MSPATHTNQSVPVRLVAEAARRVARSMRDLTSYEEQEIDRERAIERDMYSPR